MQLDTNVAPGRLGTIERPSLKKVAIEAIRSAILTGELKPGELIRETGLARRLGTAQGTVREALIELEYQGFIERHGPRRICITSLSRSQIGEMYVVRTRLETLAVELLAANRRAQLDRCRAEYRRMVAATTSPDPEAFYEADLNFHRELWRAAGNRSLTEMLERLVPRLFAFVVIRQARPRAEKLIEVAQQHGRLIDAIAAGQIETASALMVASMEQARMDDVQMP